MEAAEGLGVPCGPACLVNGLMMDAAHRTTYRLSASPVQGQERNASLRPDARPLARTRDRSHFTHLVRISRVFALR